MSRPTPDRLTPSGFAVVVPAPDRLTPSGFAVVVPTVVVPTVIVPTVVVPDRRAGPGGAVVATAPPVTGLVP